MLLLGALLAALPCVAAADDASRLRVPRTALWQWTPGGAQIAPDELDPRPARRRAGRPALDSEAWADQVRDRFEVRLAEGEPAVGRMIVFSVPRPGAQVHVDGVYKGVTPTMLQVSAGVHVVQVGFPGESVVERSIDLTTLRPDAAVEVVIEITGDEQREAP